MDAARTDQAVRSSLDILKRSLLLLGTPSEGMAGISEDQAAVKKRFYGLEQAVEEVSRQKMLQSY